MQFRTGLAAIIVGALLAPAAAQASNIVDGQTLSGVTVAGQASVYEIFGHPGNTGGDFGPDLPAVLTTFTAGGGNVFTFSATGAVSCCQFQPNNIPPDGSDSQGMSVVGINGLSSLSGNTHIPLVGVFTSDTDPNGGAAPAALSFNASSPLSLSPLLNQVFYIGDGRAGLNDAAGAQLTFTAPTAATRLYLGAIDANGFGGVSGFYNDNGGSFSVDVHLAVTPSVGAPEPAVWAMMLVGFAGLGATIRGRRAATAA